MAAAFPGGVARGTFEPDLTNISVRAWATHSLTLLDLGRQQRGTDALTPSCYGRSPHTTRTSTRSATASATALATATAVAPCKAPSLCQ